MHVIYHRIFFIVGSIMLIYQTGAAQDDLNTFTEVTQKYNYFLTQTDIQNFSCLFTTSSYIEFAKTLDDTTAHYPLKFIWTRSGKSYFVLQPYSFQEDSLKRQQILEKIQNTKNQFYGFYLDWVSFLIVSPLDDVPPGAEIQFHKDTVTVRYTNMEGEIATGVKKIFLRSGHLLSIEVSTGGQKIVNFPHYQEREGQWVCTGWDTQIYKENQVTSGISTRLELRKITDYWFPSRADVVVQTAQKPEEKYLSIIFIKDYRINQAFEELPSPRSRPDSLRRVK